MSEVLIDSYGFFKSLLIFYLQIQLSPLFILFIKIKFTMALWPTFGNIYHD